MQRHKARHLKRRHDDSSCALSNEELQKVRVVARQDPFLYPLVECAISTGMRLKDIANLRWESIDLKDGFITYNAMKTGSFCEVPFFPGLRTVFEGLLIEKDPNEPLVFPDAARM